MRDVRAMEGAERISQLSHWPVFVLSRLAPCIRPPPLRSAGPVSAAAAKARTHRGRARVDVLSEARRPLQRLRRSLSHLGDVLGSSSWLRESRPGEQYGRAPNARGGT